VFTHFTIHLKGPVCTCEDQHLEWQLMLDTSQKILLVVHCSGCDASIQVPFENLKAAIALENPYPGVIKKAATTFTENDLKFLREQSISPKEDPRR